MTNKKIIEIVKADNANNIMKEYIKCINSFTYFCYNYVQIENKEETLCNKCYNHEHCNK